MLKILFGFQLQEIHCMKPNTRVQTMLSLDLIQLFSVDTSMPFINSSTDLPVSLTQEQLVRREQDNSAAPKGGEEKVPCKKIIRDLGLKVTEQRLLILEIVRCGPSHFTAQEIFESVSARNPAVGFATVYRFLRTLSENNYVTEVRMGGMPARYEWAEKKHHDHLTCTACGKIVEFENSEIEALQDRVAAQHGFKLSGHILELYGLCPSCRATPQSSAPRT
jgi:Fur family ferric uptake transcriptional regulator